MKRRVAPLLLTLVSIGVSAGPLWSQALQADERPCARNFTAQGSVRDGLSFRTHAEAEGGDVASALIRAEQAIARAGYQITNANPASGLISSSAHSGGVTLNVILAPGESGSLRMDMVVQLRSGLSTAQAAVRQEFCTIIGATLTPES